MTEAKGFVMYSDYRQHMEIMEDSDCGRLFKAILAYADNGDVIELDGMAKMAFSFIKAQMDRDFEKYADRCERNRAIAAERENKKRKAKEQAVASSENCTAEINEHSDKSTTKHERSPESTTSTNTNNNTNINTSTNTNTNNNNTHTDVGACDENGFDLRDDACADNHRRKECDPRFTQFWEAFPKKASRPAALRTWNELSPDEALFDRIMAAVDAHKRSQQWCADGGRYIPYPVNWLKNRAWENVTDHIPRSSSLASSHEPSFDLGAIMTHAMEHTPTL